MEDIGTLAADCVVVSCCCPCLILQVLILILLKIPYRVIKKTKQYAKKKLRNRGRKKKVMERGVDWQRDELLEFCERLRIGKLEEFSINGEESRRGCMEEVEKLFEELSKRGEFAFGSFWGRERSRCTAKHVISLQFENNVVQYQLIEMVGSLSCS